MVKNNKERNTMNKENEKYIYKVVGENLKRIRRAKGYSVVKLSMESNYSEGFIRNIESPSYLQTFSLGTIYHLAQILNVPITDFFQE